MKSKTGGEFVKRRHEKMGTGSRKLEFSLPHSKNNYEKITDNWEP